MPTLSEGVVQLPGSRHRGHLWYTAPRGAARIVFVRNQPLKAGDSKLTPNLVYLNLSNVLVSHNEIPTAHTFWENASQTVVGVGVPGFSIRDDNSGSKSRSS